ncbi:MAG: GH92 family glycosyl hydrolase [Armatimonadota bacterium]|nr:GH92 family glycosyl hydrolase [bacterium]
MKINIVAFIVVAVVGQILCQNTTVYAGTDYAAIVDPFLGSEASALPERKGFAKRWSWIKPDVGNTHPGACRPFGMVSVTPYSGAYVSGYGINGPSSCPGKPPRAFDKYTATGFTHFQQSGTGMINIYYNYLRVIPLTGGVDQIGTRWDLRNETAHPGYYSADLAETNVKVELTVGRKCAVHRYTFDPDSDAAVAVDLTAGGLACAPGNPSAAELQVISDTQTQGHVVCAGLPIYFYISSDAGKWHASIFQNGKLTSGKSLSVEHCDANTAPFGLLLTSHGRFHQSITLKIGFSLRSVQQAKSNLEHSASRSFDKVVADAYDEWNRYLGRFDVRGGTADQRQIFYTALYHSLIKPCDFTGENPKTTTDDPFFLDFVTLWDTFKTQVPLVNAIYPDQGCGSVNSLLGMAQANGAYPGVAVVMNRQFNQPGFDEVGSMLSQIVVGDAFSKEVEGVDWSQALKLMYASFRTGKAGEFAKTGHADYSIYALDYSYAAYCASEIAKGIGDLQKWHELMTIADKWKTVYDPASGLLQKGTYYEGGPWNYSFRLLQDMASRIAMCGGEEAFCNKLDAYFGFRDPKDEPDYTSWEALNNEADLETPYNYIYAGRHDKTAEVVSATMKYQFSIGRGGLPGDDDSGGTSSWYVWSSIGIFPVVGQDIFLIGSPIFAQTTISLGNKKFVIEAKNVSDENIYVQSALLNGKPLDRAYLHFSEIKTGGRLTLIMDSSPSTWANGSRPPSYRVVD